MIYTDDCCDLSIKTIKERLDLDIVKRLDEESWNVNDALLIITDPKLTLAVINSIDDISLMEIGLLNFMCKPILITVKAIEVYPAVIKTATWIDKNCNLKETENSFISWYKYTIGEKKNNATDI